MTKRWDAASPKENIVDGMRTSPPLASDGDELVSEDESIPDSYCCGGPSEGDDKDHGGRTGI